MNITEATRKELIDKSKSADIVKSYGETRYERRLKQHVINSIAIFNMLDMNALFKADVLSFIVPVEGESDDYMVKVIFDKVCEKIKDELRFNNNQLEYKVIYRAIVNAINQQNIRVSCNCLHPDTKIKLLDGSEPTVKELLDRYNSGEQLWCFSSDDKGDFKPGKITNVFISGEARELVKVTLDNDKEILTTLDHLYMIRDGSYKEAKNLKIGDSLMPLYFNESKKGYDMIKLNSAERGWKSVYKLVADELFLDKIKEKKLQSLSEKSKGLNKLSYDVAIHHKNFDKKNNNPDNLEVMTSYEHWKYHADNVSRLWANPEYAEKMSKKASLHIKNLNNNPTEKLKLSRVENGKKSCVILNSEENKKKFHDIRSKNMKLINSRKTADELSLHGKKIWDTEDKRRNMMDKRISKVIQRILDAGEIPSPETYDKFRYRQNPDWSKLFDSWESLSSYFKLNHKVKNIELITLETKIPVYDLTIENWHNFLVEPGVFLHNCGDFKYRLAYQATQGDFNSGQPENRPARITNPNDSDGAGCKHILNVLGNLDWALKLATSIYNYIKYMEDNYPDKFERIIFPRIFPISYSEYTNTEEDFEEPVEEPTEEEPTEEPIEEPEVEEA